MNIFVTSPDPVECALALDDKRLVKMVLETAQIMSAVCDRHRCWNKYMYRVTHRNHPCTLWAGDTSENFWWLYRHGKALSEEYSYRYLRIHQSSRVIFNCRNVYLFSPIAGEPTPFVNCTNFKELPVHRAYKQALNEKWRNDKRPPTWKGREQPHWREKS